MRRAGLAVAALLLTGGLTEAVAQDASFAPPPSLGQPLDDCPDPTVGRHLDLGGTIHALIDQYGDLAIDFHDPAPAVTGVHRSPQFRLDFFQQTAITGNGALILSQSEGVSVAGSELDGGFPGGGLSKPGADVRSVADNCLYANHPGCPPPIWSYQQPGLNGPPGGGSIPLKGTWFAHQQSGSSLFQGRPAAVYHAERDAAHLVHYEDAAGQDQARIHLPDGGSMDFELLPTVDGPGGRSTWVLSGYRDAWDNHTQIVRDSSGRITETVYPSGVREVWTWQVPAAAGISRISVRYDLDGDDQVTSQQELDTRWGMEFAHREAALPGGGTTWLTKPFGGALLSKIYYPRTEWVEASASDQPFDTSTVHTGHLVIQQSWETGSNGHPRVASLQEFRSTSLWGAAATPVTTFAAFNYDASQGRDRLQSHTDRHGATTTYAYHIDQVTQEPDLIDVTDPRGTVTQIEVDGYGRKTRVTVTPPLTGAADTRPRTNDPLWSGNSSLHEPQSVEWVYGYGGSGACGCAKPTTIQAPGPNGPRTTTYTWDSWGYPLTRTSADPATAAAAGATVVTQWTWERDLSSPANSGVLAHSAPLLTGFSSPAGSWTKNTTSWTPRDATSDCYGRKPVSQSLKISVQKPAGSTAEVVTTHRSWTAAGWPATVNEGDGVELAFDYTGSVAGLPTSITRQPAAGGTLAVRTDFTWDSFGNLLTRTDNATASGALPRTTTFTHDGEGRLLSAAVVMPSDGIVGTAADHIIRREWLRDFWGHVAVERISNLDSKGQAPAASGSSSARAWIETHRHFEGDRLIRELVDRRALDEGTAGAISDATDARFLETTIDHYPDGTPHHIYLPSGATRTLQIDGFGTLYASTLSNATESLVEQRLFVDAALDVVKVHKGDPTSGPSLWTTIERDPETGAITEITEPVHDPVAGSFPYTGSFGGAEHRFTLDSSARVTEYDVYGNGALLARQVLDWDELGRLRSREVHSLTTPNTVDSTFYHHQGLSLLERVRRGDGRQIRYQRDDLQRPFIIYEEHDPVLIGAPTEGTYLTYWDGTDLVKQRSTQAVEHAADGTQTLRAFTSQFHWDRLGRLRQIDARGDNAPGTPAESHAFWYYSTGATQSHQQWQGGTRPPVGAGGSREHHYLPDALGRLVEQTLLGDASTADIVLHQQWSDWTDAGTARTRLIREDGEGHATVTHYDFAGRPDIVQRPGAPTQAPVKTPALHTLYATYDAASRVAELVHGVSHTNQATGLPQAPTTEFLWNGAGHLIARQFPDVGVFDFHSVMATREVFERDALGRAFRATTYSGDLASAQEVVSVAHDRDGLGRLHSETYAFGWLDFGKTDTWTVGSEFGSSLPDHRSKLSYHSGLEISAQWDDLGRLDRLDWQPQGTPELLAEYTHFGAATKSRTLKPDDAASGGVNILSEWEFDAHGRNSRIHDRRLSGGAPVATLTDYQFGFDAFGNLITEAYDRQDGSSGTTNDGDVFAYDRFHRLQQATLGATKNGAGQVTGFVRQLTYQLDAAGNRTQVDSDDGSTATQTDYQTTDNRYTQVEDLPLPANPAQLVHDDRGNYAWDGETLYVYDFKDRLSEVWILVEDEDAAEQTPLTGTQTFDSQQLEADLSDAGSLAAARHTILDRLGVSPDLLAANVPQMQRRGMLTERVALDPSTTLRDSSGQSFTAGSTTSSQIQPALQLIALYAYDPFDRRVGRVLTEAAETWLHVYDGWQEIEELLVTQPGGSGNEGTKIPAKQFVWGERLDELVAYRRFGVLPGGGLGWETFHATQLGHESVTRILDADGNLVEQIVYDPFGMPQVFDANENYLGASSGTGLPFLWKGHRVDAETGLVYIRHRYYSREWGRFLSVDPIGVWGDRLNLGSGYSYGSNAPQNTTDPHGLQSHLVVWFGGFDDGATGIIKQLSEESRIYSNASGSEAEHVYMSHTESVEGVREIGTRLDALNEYNAIMSGMSGSLGFEGWSESTLTVTVVGHSYGGKAATQTVKWLEQLGHSVDYLITLDPVSSVDLRHPKKCVWINAHRPKTFADHLRPPVPGLGEIVGLLLGLPLALTHGTDEWVTAGGGRDGAEPDARNTESDKRHQDAEGLLRDAMKHLRSELGHNPLAGVIKP